MQGLTSLTQSENSNDVKFFTRLIPLGSTKNIDRSRYGYSRLQLPDKSTYVDRNTQYGLYEYVEETAFAISRIIQVRCHPYVRRENRRRQEALHYLLFQG
ncbi:MAG: hypothetical protein V8Q76_01335 [Bacteroides intestinalis]